MEIKIYFFGKAYPIKVNENDSVEDLKKKCVQNILKKFKHKDHHFFLRLMENK